MPRAQYLTRRQALKLGLTATLFVAGCAPPPTGPAAAPASGSGASTTAPAASGSPATGGPAAAASPAAGAAAAASPATTGAAAAASPAAKPAAGGAPAGGSGVLRVGSVSDIVTLHPARLSVASDRMMAGMVYSNLVRFKLGTTELLPDLAEKWERSPDGKTYTFHLRKGVQFHKGYGELTSSDVKFTIEFYQDKDKSVKSRSAGLFEAVDRVETPDPYTAVIQLSQPFIGFIETLAWQNALIVSEKAARELGENLTQQPVGTGPFELTTWNKGQEVVFTRFANYFGTPAGVAEVRIKIIPEQTTQILAVSRGELDAAYISTIPGLKTARATQGVQVIEQQSNWVNVIRMNLKSGPAANQKIRQALAYAIDGSGISEASAGFSEPIGTVINPFVLGYTTDLPKYEYDPAKAKALLAEAGYNNEPLSIVYYASGQYGELAQIAKDAWTKVGVNAQLDQVDTATWTSRGVAGQFDAFMVGVARNTPDEYFSANYRTGAAGNYGGYSSPDVDALMVKARSQSDDNAAKQVYQELQTKILTDLPAIPISLQKGVWAVSPKVKGFTFDQYASIAGFQFVQLD